MAADKTGIEWTDATWNPVTGCTKISPGCAHCYAEAITLRFKRGGPFLPGKATIRLHPERLNDPGKWRSPRMIFVNSMSDLFHEEVPFEFVTQVFRSMEFYSQHTYQILTKRPARMLEYVRWSGNLRWPDNIWAGVSVENQYWADKRIPVLEQVPAKVRFLSVEPLLKPVNLKPYLENIHWVIVGGESGPKARPIDPDWVRQIRDDCLTTGVPFFFKQWGGRTSKAGGHLLDNNTWNQYPEIRRIVKMPTLERDVGSWTIEKLTFLREYLSAYVRATKSIRKWANVCYMDIFAGPGKDRNRETGEVVDGSAVLAMGLYPGFSRFIFVDMKSDFTEQLNGEAKERGIERVTHTITGDCNVVISDALNFAPTDGATFCFVDPPGLDVGWETIKAIAQHKPAGRKKVELFVLFAYDMDLVRFLVREGGPSDIWGPDVERRINMALPDAVRWKRIYGDRNDRKITPKEARRRFAYLYWMGLKGLGYKFVLKPKLLTSNAGRPLYFLFFASDSDVGERIMSHVLTKPRPFEQLAMPIIEDPWDFREGEAWYEESLRLWEASGTHERAVYVCP